MSQDAWSQGGDQLFPHAWYCRFHILFEEMAQLVPLFSTGLGVTQCYDKIIHLQKEPTAGWAQEPER